MRKSEYKEFERAQPYFDLVRGALGDLVEGDHFFDVVTEDTIYEVLYDLSWPRVIKGRKELMDAFRAYCEAVELQAADHLIVHVTDNSRVIIIEYEVHGTMLASEAKYDNRFCSVIALENRKIANWRDYMDSFAAWQAMTTTAEREGRK